MTSIIVGAAIIQEGRLLAACRADPPELAGWWELPGGKVEDGEEEADAIRRECREELDVDVAPLHRLGEWPIDADRRLRVWTARLRDGAPRAVTHRELRWLAAEELYSVAWLPADLPVIGVLDAQLRNGRRGP